MMAPRFRPLGRNPNKHTKQGMGMLDDAMSRHGYVAPMTAAADGAILDGNARLETAAVRFPGVEPIIVEHDGTRPIVAVRTDIPSADDPRARDIIVTANRVAEVDLAYDIEVLREFVVEGLDLAPFEFDAPMLDELGGTTAGLTDPDDVPELRKTDIVRGDLFQLGQHRLLCGDSTNAEDVARVMGGEKAALMVTDPPYGIEYDPEWRERAGISGHTQKMGRVTNDNRSDWSDAWRLFDGPVAYVWHGCLGQRETFNALEGAGFEIRYELVWKKTRPVFSRGHYHAQYEVCAYAVRENASSNWVGSRDQSTVWEIDARDDSGHGHGTQKPVECMARPVKNHEASIVYEPFSGSGTTIIACEQLTRRCYAIEIEPAYVQVAIDRWEAFTGQKAVKLP